MTDPDSSLRIPAEELEFEVGTSAGPGGQHVNRVQTRVTVCFNVATSKSLTDTQKELVFERLGSRINKDGILKVRSQRHRSQRMNRLTAIERLEGLLREAITVSPLRVKRERPRAAQERRLQEKRRRARLKKSRMPPDVDPD